MAKQRLLPFVLVAGVLLCIGLLLTGGVLVVLWTTPPRYVVPPRANGALYGAIADYRAIDRIEAMVSEHPEWVNMCTGSAMTPIASAVQSRRPDVVALLLDHGADPTIDPARTEPGPDLPVNDDVIVISPDFSALATAAFQGDVEVLRMMLEHEGAAQWLDAEHLQRILDSGINPESTSALLRETLDRLSDPEHRPGTPEDGP